MVYRRTVEISSFAEELGVEPTNVDNIKYYNISSEANFGSTASPEYSKRTLLLQFQILP